MDIDRGRLTCLCFQVPEDEVTEISEATEATDATDISEASDQDNNKKARKPRPLHSLSHILNQFLVKKRKSHVRVNAPINPVLSVCVKQSFVYVCSCSVQGGEEGEDSEAAIIAQYTYVGATTNIHPYLSAMVNYAQPVKFQSFDVAEGEFGNFSISFYCDSAGLSLIYKDAKWIGQSDANDL